MKHIGNDERNRIKFMLGYGKKNTLSSSQRKQTLSSPIPVLSLHPVYLHHLAAHSLTLPAHPALLHHFLAPKQLPSPKKSIRQTSFAPLRFFRKEFSSFNTSSISPRNAPTQNPFHQYDFPLKILILLKTL